LSLRFDMTSSWPNADARRAPAHVLIVGKLSRCAKWQSRRRNSLLAEHDLFRKPVAPQSKSGAAFSGSCSGN
jgi:hypothetical protein